MDSPPVLVHPGDLAPVQTPTGWTRAQAAYNGYGHPDELYANVAPKVVYPRYKAHQALRLGVVQIVGGLLCIVANAVAIKARCDIASVGSGIWCGILYIITGTTGVAAAKFVSKCKLVSCMILCIISAVSALLVFFYGLVGVLNAEQSYQERVCNYNYGRDVYGVPCSMNLYPVRLSMNILLVLLALLEAVVSVWGSAICCKVACCCAPPPELRTPVYIPMQSGDTRFDVLNPPQLLPSLGLLDIPYSQHAPIVTLHQPLLEGGTAPNALIPPTTGREHRPPSYSSLPPPYSETDCRPGAPPNNV